MKFKIDSRWGKARVGEMVLSNGSVQTPVFMPVGTRASVKALGVDDLNAINAEIILGNTYHLYLRPGEELIHSAGKLQTFTRWQKPMLTDSGGYQVSSLGHFRTDLETDKKLKAPKIDDDGVTFWSHLDGSEHRFTAEKSIQIQEKIGADIIMAFDEATPAKGKEYAQQAMDRTHAWLKRSIDEWKKLESNKDSTETRSELFGIIQGGTFEDLRRKSAAFIVEQNLPGVAIGGGSIGVSRKETSQNVDWIYDLLPKEKPLYLMGVGVNPEDLISAILDGADMFDCVAPTRLARTGNLYVGELTDDIDTKDEKLKHKVDFDTDPGLAYISEHKRGRVVISQSIFKDDHTVLSEYCDCSTCRQGYTRAYLRHLYKSGELLYYRLASVHNVRHMIRTVEKMRAYISQYGS